MPFVALNGYNLNLKPLEEVDGLSWLIIVTLVPLQKPTEANYCSVELIRWAQSVANIYIWFDHLDLHKLFLLAIGVDKLWYKVQKLLYCAKDSIT